MLDTMMDSEEEKKCIFLNFSTNVVQQPEITLYCTFLHESTETFLWRIPISKALD